MIQKTTLMNDSKHNFDDNSDTDNNKQSSNKSEWILLLYA